MNPPRADRDLVAVLGRQREVSQSRDTATDAVTRRRAQRRAAEDGAWWVRVASMLRVDIALY